MFLFLINSSIKMALSITLTGNSSILEADFFPQIELNGDYEIGLISFITFNSIPNICHDNNMFYYGDDRFVEIPIGSYEISDLSKVINDLIKTKDSKDTTKIIIKLNENTFQCIVKCTKIIYFNKPRSLGTLMGFENCIIQPNIETFSNTTIDIMNVNAIRIDCNISNSSFLNGEKDHIIHEFSLNVGIGYKVIERPLTIIYHRVAKETISNLTLKVLDERNQLIDFRNEKIIIRVHIRPC